MALFGILAFFVMVGAPYLHAHDPGHKVDQCPASQVLHSGAAVVPAPLVVACDAQLAGFMHISALPLQDAEPPTAWQPRAPPC
jgi:hypothetical protein